MPTTRRRTWLCGLAIAIAGALLVWWSLPDPAARRERYPQVTRWTGQRPAQSEVPRYEGVPPPLGSRVRKQAATREAATLPAPDDQTASATTSTEPTTRNRPATISGTVRGPAGRPISGARVTASEYGTGVVDTVLTGSDGSYTLRLLEEVDPDIEQDEIDCDIAVWDGEHAPALREDTKARAGEVTAGIDFKLAKGAAVLGLVVDERGAPIAGAWVATVAQHVDTAIDSRSAATIIGELVRGVGQVPPEPGELDDRAVTDGLGRFRIGGLAADTYRVTAVSRHHIWEATATLQLPAAAEVRCELELATGEAITGVVVGPAGEAVAGATIETSIPLPPGKSGFLGTATSETDVDGRFLLVGLPKGIYALEVMARGYASSSVAQIDAGSTDVYVALELGGVIHGVIRDLATGAPISVAYAKARAAGNRNLLLYSTEATKQDGTYRIEGVPDGAWWVEASASGMQMRQAEQTHLSPGGVRRLDLTLEAAPK